MAKPKLVGVDGKPIAGERPPCPVHLPQPIDYNVLYNREGTHIVGLQAKTLFCPNCGFLMELDHDLLQGGVKQ